jgi:hypothetical protein
MRNNQVIYQQAKNHNRPVMIIEVGNLLRNITWRISLDHINGLGKFGNDFDLDPDRPRKLGVELKPLIKNRRREILIACQHEHSLQWQGNNRMSQWAEEKINEIRKYTDIPITVRPHPRSLFSLNLKNVRIDMPKPVPSTYDDFNFDYNYHCIVNHNSGPAVRAAINGIPVITDSTSLAYPVSDVMENIESPVVKDRDDWFLKLLHTEWTVEEIASGIPTQRILQDLKSKS